jgi:hypothetical protein
MPSLLVEIRILLTFYPGWLQTTILLTFAFQEADITGVSPYASFISCIIKLLYQQIIFVTINKPIMT